MNDRYERGVRTSEDTAALEVCGFAGNYRQTSVLNEVVIRINGNRYSDAPGMGSGHTVYGVARVEPYLDTLSFRRMASIKVD